MAFIAASLRVGEESLTSAPITTSLGWTKSQKALAILYISNSFISSG